MTNEDIESVRNKVHLGLITEKDVLHLLEVICLQQMKLVVLEKELMSLRCSPRLGDTYPIEVYEKRWGL